MRRMDQGNKTWALKAVQARTGRDPEELLRELYVSKRHSQQEIADALGVSRTLVTKWLAEFGIRREDREPLDPLVAA